MVSLGKPKFPLKDLAEQSSSPLVNAPQGDEPSLPSSLQYEIGIQPNEIAKRGCPLGDWGWHWLHKNLWLDRFISETRIQEETTFGPFFFLTLPCVFSFVFAPPCLIVLLSPRPPWKLCYRNKCKLVVPKPIVPPRSLGGLTERFSGLLPKIWIQ